MNAADALDLIRGHYDRAALTYSARTLDVDMAQARELLVRHLAPGASVLDAGCGSGRDARAFQAAGFETHAFDASSNLAALAAKATGLPVACHTFAELETVERFDAVWACASLVHLADAEFQVAVANLLRALKPGGVLYLAVKKGAGLRVDERGLPYNDFTLDRLMATPELLAMTLLSACETAGALNPLDVWLNVVLRKDSV